MNNHKSLFTYFLQFKESKYYLISVYSAIIVISCMLVVVIIIPLVQNFIKLNEQVATVRSEIAILQDNTTYLNSFKPGDMDHDYSIASQAVLQSKDFIQVIQAITTAALITQVTLADFNLDIGSILKNNAKVVVDTTPFTIDVNLTGSVDNVIAFVREIKHQLPLFSSIKLTYDNNEANVTLQVALQPFSQAPIDLSQKKIALTPQSQQLLATFSQWQASNAAVLVNASSSASSAPASNLPAF